MITQAPPTGYGEVKEPRLWRSQDVGLPQSEIIQRYEAGFAGVCRDADRMQQLDQQEAARTGFGSVDEAAHAMGWDDSGAGKLILPFVFPLQYYPGCWPGAAQDRGDCVSHGAKNTCLTTLCCEVAAGLPDEVSGVHEECPPVPDRGRTEGVLSSESIYWHRGYNGDGWYGSAAAEVIRTYGMSWTREPHEVEGYGTIDLTIYSGRLAGKWGRTPPPAYVKGHWKDHKIRTTAYCRSWEAVRDALANGYGCETCGGQGFSNQRDEHGYSRRSGSWSHSMHYSGYDDRDWAKQKYGCPLVLTQNSWGRWNRGPRDVYDSASLVPAERREEWERAGIVNPQTGNIMIPEGSFWAKTTDMGGRDTYAYSGAEGWPRQRLPYAAHQNVPGFR